MLQCGHTACPRCVIVDGDGMAERADLQAAATVVRCPAWNETQAMPPCGVTGLARDLVALAASRADAAEMRGGVGCAQCGRPATLACVTAGCGDGMEMVRLCAEHGQMHEAQTGHAAAPMDAMKAGGVGGDAAAAMVGAADLVCAAHPGA